jgi:hypothetical protein
MWTFIFVLIAKKASNTTLNVNSIVEVEEENRRKAKNSSINDINSKNYKNTT